MTIVPTRLFTARSIYRKIELAIAKGKKIYDKRETIKHHQGQTATQAARLPGNNKVDPSN